MFWTIFSEYILLDQLHSLVQFFEDFVELVLDHVLDFELDQLNRLQLLVDSFLDLKVSHETIDFELALPRQNGLIVFIFDLLVHDCKAFGPWCQYACLALRPVLSRLCCGHTGPLSV